MIDVDKLSSELVEKQSQYVCEELASLIQRGILVVHKTLPEISTLELKDGNYKVTLSQRIGLKVETEKYIAKLEKEIEVFREVEKVARGIYDDYHTQWDDLKEALQKLDEAREG